MSKFSSRLTVLVLALVFLLGLAGCAPEVGSEGWCEKMKEKDKAKWTAEDAANFAKHCIL